MVTLPLKLDTFKQESGCCKKWLNFLLRAYTELYLMGVAPIIQSFVGLTWYLPPAFIMKYRKK